MRAIVTGSHGAVAPFIINELKRHCIDVIIYDRSKHDILSYDDNYNFIKESKADFFFHIATGDIRWIEIIADVCTKLDVKLIYTSTVSVYSEEGSGPYSIVDEPHPSTDYGRYKLRGEEIVRQNPKNLICRLGWQIGYREGSNNMLDFLSRQHKERGFIGASSLWFPSCCFLDDTALELVDLALLKSGTYLLNSNLSYSFYEIVCYINKLYNMHWDVRIDDSFARDDRMFDPRIDIQKIKI